MHDDEPDTFVYETLPERVASMLSAIGVSAKANDLGEGRCENSDYYGRHFSSTPRMVTNRGSVKISGSNFDAVHIIQKG